MHVCSVALQSTSIWTNAIGMEQQVNRNEEIERQINAPTFGGGGGRAARRAAAAEAVEATGTGRSSLPVPLLFRLLPQCAARCAALRLNFCSL